MSDPDAEEVLIAGMTAQQLEEEGQANLMSCYLCRREEGDEIVAVNLTRDLIGTSRLEMLRLSIPSERMRLIYPVCRECVMLLEAIASSDFEVL